jgi:hypothetical protein
VLEIYIFCPTDDIIKTLLVHTIVVHTYTRIRTHRNETNENMQIRTVSISPSRKIDDSENNELLRDILAYRSTVRTCISVRQTILQKRSEEDKEELIIQSNYNSITIYR